MKNLYIIGNGFDCHHGIKELEKLRGKDEVVPFAIGNAHQIEYDYTGTLRKTERILLCG